MQAHYSNRKIFGDDNELLLIEQVQTDGKKVWMYYEYLRYGILDTSDRPSSYVGLSVITDTLCADAKLMLDLCRKAFNKYLVGKLLQPKDGTFQISDALSAQENVRVEIENSFADILVKYQDLGMLEDVPVSASPMPYQPLSLNNEKQVLCRLNPVDATPAKIKEQIQAGKKVAVSDNYPTLAQRQFVDEKTRIAGELASCKTRLAETKASLDHANKQAVDVRSQNRKLQDEIVTLKEGNNRNSKKLQDELDREKRKFEETIKKYEAKGNYAMQVQLDEIKAMLQVRQQKPIVPRLAPFGPERRGKGIVPGSGPFVPERRGKGIPKTMIFVVALVIVVILAVVLSVSMCSGDEKNPGKSGEKDNVEYVEETSDNAVSWPSSPSIVNKKTLDNSSSGQDTGEKEEPLPKHDAGKDKKAGDGDKDDRQRTVAEPDDEERPLDITPKSENVHEE